MSTKKPGDSHAEKIAAWKAKQQQANIQRQQQSTAPWTPNDEVLPPVRIAGVLPNLPDPPVDGDQTNLLEKSKTQADLEVIVPFASNFLPTVISGTWDGLENFIAPVTIPAGSAVTEQKMYVRRAALGTSGEHRIVGRALNNLFNDSTPEFVITIDHDRPNHGNTLDSLTFEQKVLDGITQDLLDQDGGITGTLTEVWGDIARGDRVRFYWAKQLARDVREEQGIVVGDYEVLDPYAPISVTVSKEDIRAAGAGIFVLWYRVYDRAGNDTAQAQSEQTRLTFITTDSPVFVGALTLDTFSGGLTREDLYLGGGLSVPEHVTWYPGDEAQVYWDDMTVPAQINYPAPGPRFLLPLRYSTVSSTGQTGTAVDVKVKVVRAGTNIGSFTNTIQVDYDLSVPGPVIPQPELGPENPNLALVLVKSKSWGGSADNNKLLPADVGEPATAEVLLVAGFAIGEKLALMWPGVEDPVDTVTILNNAIDFVIQFNIPWAAIEAGEYGPEVSVYYRVIGDTPADGYQASRVTLVDSQLGGIVDLPDLSVTGKQLVTLGTTTPFQTYLLICNDMFWAGVSVSIPRAEGKYHVGAKLKVTFTPYDALEGGGTPGTPEETAEYTLNQSEVDLGFDYVIPFTAAMRASVRNRTEIFYTINDSGPTGSSAPVNLVMYNINGAGLDCLPAQP